MEYIYTAMLLHKAGKKITEEAVKSILKAAGVAADEIRVKALVAALDGLDIDEAIKKAAVTALPAVVATAGSAAPVQEAKKEEKSKEEDQKAEESAAAGLGALFG